MTFLAEYMIQMMQSNAAKTNEMTELMEGLDVSGGPSPSLANST